MVAEGLLDTAEAQEMKREALRAVRGRVPFADRDAIFDSPFATGRGAIFVRCAPMKRAAGGARPPTRRPTGHGARL